MKKFVILFCMVFFFSRLEADFIPCQPSGNFYTKVYSILPQLVLPGEAVRLEKVGVQSREIDLSFAAGSGRIIFKRSGTYKIVWYGEGGSLFHTPWILGVSLDGVIILGNSYGNFDRYSTSEKFNGSVVVSVNAGQVLCLVNASSYPIELFPGGYDSKLPHPSFILSLSLFEPSYPNLFQ
jgi:hypothetical protein